jgi:transposase, IS5 family
VAADAAFYSAKNEAVAKAKGVKRACIPNRSTKSVEHKREQRKRRFPQWPEMADRMRGTHRVVKRRHGLNRCRYRGEIGIQRWVGLGVIADNIVNIGRALQSKLASRSRAQHYQQTLPAAAVGSAAYVH